MLIREAQHEIDKFAPIVANMQELQRRKELKNEIEMHRQGKKKQPIFLCINCRNILSKYIEFFLCVIKNDKVIDYQYIN